MIALVQVKMIVVGAMAMCSTGALFMTLVMLILIVRRARGDEKGGW